MVNFYAQHRRQAFRGSTTLWTPANLATAVWLDASDASTLFSLTSGGSLPAGDGLVARWEDKSGNGRHATQGTSGSRPIRKVAELNGLDVLRFDGSADNLTYTVPVSDPDNLTLFVIFRDRIDHSGTIWGHRSESTRLIQLTNQSSTEIRWQFRSNSSPLQAVSLGKSAAAWTIAGATLNVGGNSHNLSLNGTAGTANTTNFGSQTFTATVNTIGATNLGAGAGVFFDGDIAEFVLTSSTLSTLDQQKTQGYLAHKWGVSAVLPVDHPYKVTPPFI